MPYSDRAEYPRCWHWYATEVCYECIGTGDCERCMRLAGHCTCLSSMALPWNPDR